ncbi:YybH family protein [Marilutibacter maris]|uniref:YybH family protein n=1 Tax=Marilutibacter maris TaxID=1605891 RepID=UPI002013169D|nr:nuclear transport factor 2 family protein [Lysobacter maris]
MPLAGGAAAFCRLAHAFPAALDDRYPDGVAFSGGAKFRAQPSGGRVMNVSNRICAALLLSGLVGWASGAAVAQEMAPSAADCFLPAFKSGDADAVTACYAEDAVLWIPGGPMVKGHAEIRDAFADFFADVTIKDVQISIMGDEVMGDTRASWGTYTVIRIDKATQAESVQRGRYVEVSKMIGGRWLYIVDHPADDPPPAPESEQDM